MRKTLVLAAAVAALATTAPPAWGGTYDVWSCAGPSGEPLPATGWSRESHTGEAPGPAAVRAAVISARRCRAARLSPAATRGGRSTPQQTRRSTASRSIGRQPRRPVTRIGAARTSSFATCRRSLRDTWEIYAPALAGSAGCRAIPTRPSPTPVVTSWRLQAQRIIASAQCDGAETVRTAGVRRPRRRQHLPHTNQHRRRLSARPPRPASRIVARHVDTPSMASGRFASTARTPAAGSSRLR